MHGLSSWLFVLSREVVLCGILLARLLAVGVMEVCAGKEEDGHVRLCAHVCVSV